jgi:hypothetical protein
MRSPRQGGQPDLFAPPSGQRVRLTPEERLIRDDARGEAQRCDVCNTPYSPFGFGLPPKRTLWACAAHRAYVDGKAQRHGLVTGPRPAAAVVRR